MLLEGARVPSGRSMVLKVDEGQPKFTHLNNEHALGDIQTEKKKTQHDEVTHCSRK